MPSVKGLPESDQWMVRDVDRALGDAQRLLQWWRQKDETRGYARRFDVIKMLAPEDRAEGFFDEAEVSFGRLRVMGISQDMLFDRPKGASPESQCAQIREFALRYLLRVADYAPPQPKATLGFGPVLEPMLRPFRWGASSPILRHGFGYSQLFARQTATGDVYHFPKASQAAIADLRDIGPVYDWVILRARPYDYEMGITPLGATGPRLVIPLPDSPIVALRTDLVIDEERPAPGVLGRYGFAYALLHDPTPRGAQVYGPAQFKAGFQMIEFVVRESGEIRVRLAFTGDRPERVFDVPLDPIGMGLSLAGLIPIGFAQRALAPLRVMARIFPRAPSIDPLLGSIRLVDLATAGMAGRSLNISVEQLERDILSAHFAIYHGLITGALLTYRQVADWLDTERLPEWAETGAIERRKENADVPRR